MQEYYPAYISVFRLLIESYESMGGTLYVPVYVYRAPIGTSSRFWHQLWPHARRMVSSHALHSFVETGMLHLKFPDAIRDPKLAARYLANWTEHRAHSEAYVGR